MQKGRLLTQADRRTKKERERLEREIELKSEEEKAALRSYESRGNELRRMIEEQDRLASNLEFTMAKNV